jgi:hypothetical protein
MAAKEGQMDPALEDTSGFKTSSIWHRQLENTASVEEVLFTLRDYLASLTPRDLAHLPEKYRPLRIKGDDDVEYWTFRLSQHCGAEFEASVDLDLMREVFNHFLHASLRLTRIHKAATAKAEESQTH